MQEKPKCRLIGTDGNTFALLGLARQALRAAKLPDKATEMCARVMCSQSYGDALAIIQEYVQAE